MATKHRGFLLIEAMMASVVLTVAVAAIATLLVSSTTAAECGRQSATAVALARQLAEEIAAKPLYLPTGITRANTPTIRSQFAIVGDYAGYSDQTTGVVTMAGASIEPGDGQLYTRAVAVTYGTGPAGSLAPSGDFATVTVTVTTPRGRTISVTRLVGRIDLTT